MYPEYFLVLFLNLRSIFTLSLYWKKKTTKKKKQWPFAQSCDLPQNKNLLLLSWLALLNYFFYLIKCRNCFCHGFVNNIIIFSLFPFVFISSYLTNFNIVSVWCLYFGSIDAPLCCCCYSYKAIPLIWLSTDVESQCGCVCYVTYYITMMWPDMVADFFFFFLRDSAGVLSCPFMQNWASSAFCMLHNQKLSICWNP